MEVKFAQGQAGVRALRDAWALDLLGQSGRVGDLSDQIAYKLKLGSDKDWDDALHIAVAAAPAIEWARVEQMAYVLEVPHGDVERLRRAVDAIDG